MCLSFVGLALTSTRSQPKCKNANLMFSQFEFTALSDNKKMLGETDNHYTSKSGKMLFRI